MGSSAMRLSWISRRGFFGLRSPNLWNSPWLMLPRVCEGDHTVYKLYSIAEEKVISFKKRRRGGEEAAKLVGSSQGWIALFDDRNKHVFLSDPVGGGGHVKLPAIDALRDRNGNKVVVEESSSVSKVIVSWPPNICFSRAMMSLDGGAKLAVCRPRRSTHWTLLGDNTMHHDFVYSASDHCFTCLEDGKLHDWGLDYWEEEGGEKEIETGNLHFHCEGVKDWSFIPDLPLKHIKVGMWCGIKRYIVWGAGAVAEQYLVTQYIVGKTIGFQVYEIDNHRGKIVAKNGSLDGQAMFVGLNHSLALPTSEFPEFKPDSIYFAGYDEIGIYDYKTRTFLNFEYPLDHGEGIMWFTPIDYNL